MGKDSEAGRMWSRNQKRVSCGWNEGNQGRGAWEEGMEAAGRGPWPSPAGTFGAWLSFEVQ